MEDARYAMDFQFLNEQEGLFGSPAQSKPAPTAVADSDGKLWFATSGHIVSIDPATVRKEQPPPNALLQAVRVNGSAVQYDKDIRVDSRRFKNLEFDYIGVNLKSPDRVVYQYMLGGQDRDWQEAGDRQQAHYTNLPPGNYHFRVRAANGTGQWSELQSAIPFAITPAFYQTNWFLLPCAAGTGLLIWTIYKLRVHQVAMRLDSQFEARLAERTRIAQELHDTLLQGVLSASMQLNVANDQMAPDAPFKPLVGRVLELMRVVVDEGRNAVRGLRVEKGGSQDLAQAFSRIPVELSVHDGPQFRVLVEGAPRALHPIIRDEVYRIGREAITNAYRHSGAKSIQLELEYASQELRMLVRDDGGGMNPQVLQTGREGHCGLPGMRERAQKIGAKLKIFSNKGNGTELSLQVPARIAFESRSAPGSPRWIAKLYRDDKPDQKVKAYG
jgi:signal transduction histidine kinase